ncbi:MAG: hypothetical protein ACYDA9_02635 [Terriglobia bacterium]
MRPKPTTVIILVLALSLPAKAAEYKGHNIDGMTFGAKAIHFNDEYKGTVTFKGRAAVMHLRRGKEIRLWLCDERIANPYHIEAANPGNECSKFEGHPMIWEIQIPQLDTTEWPK